MKSILLPTDFSTNSINAIHYAVNLLKNESCEFYLINIQTASSFISDDLMTMSSSASIYETIIGTAKKSINNLIQNLETKFINNNHSFNPVVDYDNFIDAINQICETKHIDLIIMGTKGATGAQKVIFGSNTARVMQRCSTPILAIPNDCKFVGIDKIALTSNYSRQYEASVLKPLMDIVKMFNSKIDILHFLESDSITQSQKNNKDFLDESFSEISHEFVDLKTEAYFKTTHDYIENHNIKMLAMMRKKHSFFERFFARHLVETFAFNIDIPFLVMKNEPLD